MAGKSRPGQTDEPPSSRIRILWEKPTGIRIQVRASWRARVPWLLGLLAAWTVPALTLYRALAPTLSQEAAGVLLTVLWGLPGALAGLGARLLHQRRELSVRVGELELDSYAGGRHTRDRYRFEDLELTDPDTLGVCLHPGAVPLELGDGLDPASCAWLADRLLGHANPPPKEAASDETAPLSALRS